MCNKKCAFILGLVAVILLDFLLFNPWQKIPLSTTPLSHEDDLQLAFDINTDNLTQPSFQNTIRAIFSVPFDLQWYNFCFENIASSNDSVINPTLGKNVNVLVNNKSSLIIPPGSSNCVLYNLGDNVMAQNAFKINYVENITSIDKSSSVPVYHVSSTIEAFAKPEAWSITIKIILFFIAGLALLNLLRETCDFLFD